MKRLMWLPASALLASCAVGYNPSYSFKEVQAVNLAGAPLKNVSWRVVGTDKVLNCSEVAPFAMCADYFARRRYPQSGIELSWTHPDGERHSQILNPHIPVYYSSAFPLRVVIEIDAEGGARGFYEQDEPDGEGGFFLDG